MNRQERNEAFKFNLESERFGNLRAPAPCGGAEEHSCIDLSTTLGAALNFSVQDALPGEEYRPINEIRSERSDISAETRERWTKSAERQKEVYRAEAGREQGTLRIEDDEIRKAGEELVQLIYSFNPAIRIGTSNPDYHKAVKEGARRIVQEAYDECVAEGVTKAKKIIKAMTKAACKGGRCEPHGLSEYAEEILASGRKKGGKR